MHIFGKEEKLLLHEDSVYISYHSNYVAANIEPMYLAYRTPTVLIFVVVVVVLFVVFCCYSKQLGNYAKQKKEIII